MVSFLEGYIVNPNLCAAYHPSVVVFCIAVHMMKQAGHQKSDVSLFAHDQQRCVLYQRTGFWVIYCHMLSDTNWSI
jgi:hypothetical protein